MTKQEIARRIFELTDEQRNELYRLCALRKRKNKTVNVVNYEPVDADIAIALEAKDLVTRLGPMAGVREDVYDYWLDDVDGKEADAAD